MKETIKLKIKDAPRLPGVYRFINTSGKVIYIGKANDLRSRLTSYTAPLPALSAKTAVMVTLADTVEYQVVTSELEALLLEAQLIRDFQPKYNSISKDDKHPLYIKITKEKFPKILTSRKEEDRQATYFGPFPSGSTVKSVLKLLRSIFPYCSQPHLTHRACFYSHIGLCNPCPSFVVQLEDEDLKKQLTLHYRSNIRNIQKILSGKIEQLLKNMTRKMVQFSVFEKYEEAARIRDQINQLNYIIQKPLKPDDILLDPSLPQDRALERLVSLKAVLSTYFPDIGNLNNIECYDIANISGKYAVGSQVVFTDGAPNKQLYRKYRIKTKSTPNDVGMLREVLARRIKHTEWSYPDLFIVDGGKPQVAAASSALEANDIKIPLIGLAKRDEEIILLKQGTFLTLRLSRSDPALKVIQYIRDEAHRFAQSYHHLLVRSRLKLFDNPK